MSKPQGRFVGVSDEENELLRELIAIQSKGRNASTAAERRELAARQQEIAARVRVIRASK